MRNPRNLALAGLILAIYLGLGLTNVLTKAPWCDEAWFASPAYNLAFHGFLGTTVLDPASSTWKTVKLTGIDRHTYWVLPLNLLFNAAAFRAFGFGILPMRLLSLLWGVVALAACGAILWKLTGQRWFALAGVGLIAIDFHFLAQAADGRMDVMAAALGWSGIASYLLLRERSLDRAVAVSQTLAALSLFTHPNGIMLVAMLACTTLYFDRERIRIGSIAIAAVPYLAIAAAWSLYILQSPGDFSTQFLGNAGGRGPTITTPLLALREEISRRYLANYGMASWSSLAGRINVIPLLFFAAGIGACLAIPAIRAHRGYRLLLIWTAIVVFFLTELEGLKTPFYLIYATPLFTVLMVAAAGWFWSKFPRRRIVLAAALAVFCLLQVSRTVIADSRHPRQSTYDPAVAYLREHAGPQAFIMGGAEFIFGLSPEWKILDDIRLGYNTGKKPEIVVIDPAWEDRIQALEETSPEIHAFVKRALDTDFQEVYNHEGYRILVRRAGA
ncbi:MAG: hypothetical protein JWP63_740 [Candidatus Solibacter sp.]|nr:hypothetical protein [Candidatus Solibacter sp.]